MRCASFLSLALSVVGTLAYHAVPSRTTKRTNGSPFVSVVNGEFMKDGKPFGFLGTNAYWLTALDDDISIKKTLEEIAATGLNVVRTWAFNDVDEIPETGTWFQLIQDGKVTINDGPNGLQRLDKVVQFAEELGIHVMFSLTNNWNPRPDLDEPQGSYGYGRRSNDDRPRNYLSNDYGGIDVYVRNFCDKDNKNHDEFYTNDKIISIFKNYTTAIASRYVNNPNVLGWELANDARCSSTLPASPQCNTNTITRWHDDLARHLRSVDPNHLVASGTHGFLCPDCPKLFQPVAPPTVSAAPVKKKRQNIPKFTKERIAREFVEQRKRTSEEAKKRAIKSGEGIKIRGRWVATNLARAVDTSLGSAFDGSQGVDAQDILNVPDIGFGSFQLFPDQNSYGPDDPNLSFFENALRQGLNWINLQGQVARLTNKPTVMFAFGLVTQDNNAFFVPFNSTIAPFANEPTPLSARAPTAGAAASNAQQDSAYTQWLRSAASFGIPAAQYQWGQGGGRPGSSFTPNIGGSTTSSGRYSSSVSPNDGYRISPVGSDGIRSTLSLLAPLFRR